MGTTDRIACFITPHGLGHATRACAVLAALRERHPAIAIDVYTTVPESFLAESLAGPFTYIELVCDVGLIQDTPLQENLAATLSRLATFLPFPASVIDPLAQSLVDRGTTFVLCDIAPMGLLVGQAAGLPTVLIENFTWDWIYAGYLDRAPEFAPYIEAINRIVALADYHFQTTPVCRVCSDALVVPVVSRKPRRTRQETRRALGIAEDTRLLLISGHIVALDDALLSTLGALTGVTTLMTATPDHDPQGLGILVLPPDERHYHADLVQAADGVLAKVGYSTLAEVYRAGIAHAYIPRAAFRESPPLEAFIQQQMPAIAISESDVAKGDWIRELPALLSPSPRVRDEPNGADVIADYLTQHLLNA